jgi:hypothetical protein
MAGPAYTADREPWSHRHMVAQLLGPSAKAGVLPSWDEFSGQVGCVPCFCFRTIFFIVVFSQFLKNIPLPVPAYGGKKCHISKFYLFQVFPVRSTPYPLLLLVNSPGECRAANLCPGGLKLNDPQSTVASLQRCVGCTPLTVDGVPSREPLVIVLGAGVGQPSHGPCCPHSWDRQPGSSLIT